jgi:hypothetical protein
MFGEKKRHSSGATRMILQAAACEAVSSPPFVLVREPVEEF